MRVVSDKKTHDASDWSSSSEQSCMAPDQVVFGGVL